MDWAVAEAAAVASVAAVWEEVMAVEREEEGSEGEG